MKILNNICHLFVVAVLILALSGCSGQRYYKRTEFLMGTVIEITCPDQQAIDIAFEEIKRIEGLLSKFKPESEVSRLNKLGSLKVGPDLLYVLKRSREFYFSSGDGFDITVGPLVDIWKQAIRTNELPSSEEIEKAKELVGFNKIVIDEEKSTVTFLKEGMQIDLGAIAKGYAVDRAIKKVLDFGIKSCLITAGGDIYCLGTKEGDPWEVGIQHPRNKNDLIDILRLENQAVATSGDYQQMFILNNKRYSHIIDPNTGYPADTGVIAATVIAPNCLTADALATSIFVLGKTKGLNLANYYGIKEVFVYKEEDLHSYDSF